jgi:hypothetical protein
MTANRCISKGCYLWKQDHPICFGCPTYSPEKIRAKLPKSKFLVIAQVGSDLKISSTKRLRKDVFVKVA